MAISSFQDAINSDVPALGYTITYAIGNTMLILMGVAITLGRRCSGVFFGHGYQLVLYLEGAKLFEPFFVFAAQRILRSFHYE